MTVSKTNGSQSPPPPIRTLRSATGTSSTTGEQALPRLGFDTFGKLDEPTVVVARGPSIEELNNELLCTLSNSSRVTLEQVKALVEKGANVNAKKEDGFSALRYAIRCHDKNERMKIVKYLVEKGADVNAKDIDGYTPLIQAASGGDTDIVEYLITNKINKAKINEGDNNRDTALGHAIKEKNRTSDSSTEKLKRLNNTIELLKKYNAVPVAKLSKEELHKIGPLFNQVKVELENKISNKPQPGNRPADPGRVSGQEIVGLFPLMKK